MLYGGYQYNSLHPESVFYLYQHLESFENQRLLFST